MSILKKQYHYFLRGLCVLGILVTGHVDVQAYIGECGPAASTPSETRTWSYPPGSELNVPGNLCSRGNPSDIPPYGDSDTLLYTWTCDGPSGSASCEASIPGEYKIGRCGSATYNYSNGFSQPELDPQSYSIPPQVDLCYLFVPGVDCPLPTQPGCIPQYYGGIAFENPPALNTSNSTFSWDCRGVGGGSDFQGCTANYVPPVCDTPAPSKTQPNRTDLCVEDRGIPTVITENEVSGLYEWTCKGAHEPDNVNCSSVWIRDAQCGSAESKSYEAGVTPGGEDFCSIGTYQNDIDEVGNTFTWSCNGINGGIPVSDCAAATHENGSCGTATSEIHSTAPTQNLCLNGALNTGLGVTQNGDGSLYEWQCNGINNGSLPSQQLATNSPTCSATRNIPGICGDADDSTGADMDYQYVLDINPSDFCSVGTEDNFAEDTNAQTYTWDCVGSAGTPDSQCIATLTPPPPPIDGSCGSDNTSPNNFRNPPNNPSTMCGYSSVTPVATENTSTGYWEWDCIGSGGGITPPTCTANITRDAECGSAAGINVYASDEPGDPDLCEIGNSNTGVSELVGTFSWGCPGIFGGNPENNCTANIISNGACALAVHTKNLSDPYSVTLCDIGSPTNIDSDGAKHTWHCEGDNGGNIEESCWANVQINGSCGGSNGKTFPSTPTSNLCNQGDLSILPETNTQYKWTCGGTNGGSEGICTAEKSGTAECGIANNTNHYLATDILTEDTCLTSSVDNPSIVENTGSLEFTWICAGLNPGDMDANCIAHKKVDGACGEAKTNTTLHPFETPPESDLCTTGTASRVRRGGTNTNPTYDWDCLGENEGIEELNCSAPALGKIGSVQSDIDEALSTLRVQYTAGPGANPNFTCLNQSSPDFTLQLNESPLSGLDFDGVEEAIVSNCMNQSGAYTFTLTIQDVAGNPPVTEIYRLEVLAGNVEVNRTEDSFDNCDDEIDPLYDRNDLLATPNLTPDSENPTLVANGRSTCIFNILPKDREGNEVVQSSTTKIYSGDTDIFPLSSEGFGDGNNADGSSLSFLEGLRISKDGGVNTLKSTRLTADTLSDINSANPGFDFTISALAPSIMKLGNTGKAQYVAALSPATLDLTFMFPKIDQYGNEILDGGDIDLNNVTEITQPTALLFYPLFQLQPKVLEYIDDEGNEQVVAFADSPIPIDSHLIENKNDDGFGDPIIESADVNAWLFTTLGFEEMNFQNEDINPADDENDADLEYDTFGYTFGPQNDDPVEGITGPYLESEDPNDGDFENFIYTSASGYQGQEINLATKIQYEIIDPLDDVPTSISYPSGFLGSYESLGFPEDFNLGGGLILFGVDDVFFFRFVGATIEGGVIGQVEKLSLAGTSDVERNETYSTYISDGLSANEAREAMRERAFELTIGLGTAPNIISCEDELDFSSFEHVFDDYDVVYVHDCDIRIDGEVAVDPFGSLTDDEKGKYNHLTQKLATTLPIGQNTLVIKNGNLFLDNDLWYESWAEDSFGFVLFNEDLDSYPITSNVFVKYPVKRLVGSYSLEGGIFTYKGGTTPADFDPSFADEEDDDDDDTVDETSDIISNTADIPPNDMTGGTNIATILQQQIEDFNRTQLILHGTVLSFNTLGGFHIKHSEIPFLAENFFTPWQNFPNAGDNADARKISIQYDIHYLRRFNIHDRGTGFVCESIKPSEIQMGLCLKDNLDDQGNAVPGGDGTNDYLQDVVDTDGVPSQNGYLDYSDGGFASARCTPDLEDLWIEYDGDATTGDGFVDCDPNPNAFVLRNDQKIANFPPPGFEIIESMDLSE